MLPELVHGPVVAGMRVGRVPTRPADHRDNTGEGLPFLTSRFMPKVHPTQPGGHILPWRWQVVKADVHRPRGAEEPPVGSGAVARYKFGRYPA